MPTQQTCPWCKGKKGGCPKCNYSGKITVGSYPKGKKGQPWPPDPDKK